MKVLLYVKRVFFYLCICLCFQPLKAQSPYFHTLNTQKGLLDNVNAFLFKDSRGYLWSSSLSGINRTDGLHVVTYRENSRKNNFKGLNMQANFQEDPNGRIWFGAEAFLNVYRSETDDFQYFVPQVKSGDSLSNIKIAYIDKAGEVWFTATSAKYKGLFKFNPLNQKTTYWPLDVAESHNIRAVPNAQGEVLAFLLFKYDNAQLIEWRLSDKKEAPPSVKTHFSGSTRFKFRNLHLDAHQIVWAATNEGLLYWDLKTGRYVLYNKAGQTDIGSLKGVSANSRYVVVWEDIGVVRLFSKQTGQFIQAIMPQTTDTEGGLLSYKFFLGAVLLDENDYCFLADWANGIQFTQLFKTRLMRWPQDLNVQQQDETKICPTSKNDVWLFENGRQLYKYATDGRLLMRLNWTLPFFSPRQMEATPDGSLWLLLRQPEGALVRVDAVTGRAQLVKGFTKKQQPRAFTVTPKGSVLVYTADGGLHTVIADGSNWRIQPLWNGQRPIFGGDASILETDDQGHLFIFSENMGLGTFQLATGKEVGRIRVYNVNQMVADRQSPYLWLSGPMGLSRYHLNTSEVQPIFSGTYVNFLTLDAQNRVWFTSATQLHVLDKATGRTTGLGKTDGLILSPNPVVKLAPNGRYLYVEGAYGPCRLDLASFRSYEVRPMPEVNLFRVNGESRGWAFNAEGQPEIVLRHDENFLDFLLSGIEYGAPEDVTISYFLEEWDKDTMVRLARENRVSYQRLAPGHYVFKVWASTAEGKISVRPFELKITILPPWWSTWWAYTLYALSLAGLVYGYFSYRTARLRKEATAKQKNLEMEMMAFRAQMNPHFISNALNAINAYIIRHDTLKASRYLSDFAQLMRKVLTESAQEMIAVEDEIETIEGYIKMEALRFGSGFDYEMVVDETIDTWAARMPTMIVQPFIENAILHGLMHKIDGGRVLKVELKAETEQSMLCVVEDNGIGRYKSAAINAKNRSPKHESKGMFITKYRLMMLADKYKANANFIVEDVLSEQGEVAGTRVVLRLPLIYD